MIFLDLISSKSNVKIYYGKEAGQITGVITGFDGDKGLLKINSNGIIFPLSSVAKIEVVEESHNLQEVSIG